ncbi:MAG TPA: hypothetical protein GXX75_03530 [Clostridiales bacterium]|nr:hypothetical protein [Clostridiales bacterium]
MEGIMRGIMLVVFVACAIFIIYTSRHVLKFYKEAKDRDTSFMIDKVFLFGTSVVGIVFVGYFFCAVTEYINLMAANQSVKAIMYYGYIFGILFFSIDNLLQQSMLAIGKEHFIIYRNIFQLSSVSLTGSKKYLFRVTADVASCGKKYRIRLSKDNYNKMVDKLTGLVM